MKLDKNAFGIQRKNSNKVRGFLTIDHLFIKKLLFRPIYISHIVTHFNVRQLFLKSADIWTYKF